MKLSEYSERFLKYRDKDGRVVDLRLVDWQRAAIDAASRKKAGAAK